MSYMICKHFLGLLIGHERRNRLRISLISVDGRNHRLACTGPLQIHSISAGPLPRVIDVKHRLHAPFSHFHKKSVKTAENGVIIDTRLLLKSRFHPCGNAVRTVTSDKYTKVGHTESLERIELSLKTFDIAATTLGSENRTVPEIGSDIV